MLATRDSARIKGQAWIIIELRAANVKEFLFIAYASVCDVLGVDYAASPGAVV